MTIGEIVDIVCSKIGKTDTNTKARCKEYVRYRYKMLYDKRLWIDSLLTYAVTTSDRQVIFPAKVGKVLACRQDYYMLDNSSLMAEMQISPADFDSEGTAMRIASLSPIATAVNPTNESISIVFDAADTSTVTILGEDDTGASHKEVLTGNGTTPVATSGIDWAIIHTLSRSAATTTMTVSGVTSAAELLVLEPDERSKLYQRIQFFQKPSASQTFTFMCKRAWSNLYDDSETPIIRGCTTALLAYAHADLLEYMRQYGKAQSKFAEAMALEAQYEESEVWQRGGQIQIVPEIGGDVDMGYSDYI